jgi:uncharacterized membrane protein YsdA (DUF1294 family)/cold shock CspA family protein
MRLQGKITRWDDEKGFGFISWHGDGSSTFVHIKAFDRTSRRPKVGDIVSYAIAKGTNGKSRAEKVRFSDQPKRHSSGRRQNGPLPVMFAILFVCFLFLSASFNRISWMVVVAYFAASLVTFVAYAWDKSSARLGYWRTTEASLHLMGLVGGWPGALAGQRLLRHKSSKQEFLSAFWITVFLNVAAVSYLAWSGDAGSTNQLIDGLWRNAF